jgi:MoaA/NifB/PqqE/SkfB family radical SAM enzyme
VGTKGAFPKAMEVIKKLIGQGIKTDIRCAITRENFHERDEIRKIVNDLGGHYFPYIQVHMSCDNKLDLRPIRLADEQIKTLFEEGFSLSSSYKCMIGFARCDIQPNADVTLCSLLTEPLGNLRISTFDEIWHHAPLLKQTRETLQKRSPSQIEADKYYRCSADALFDDGGLDRTSSFAAKVIAIAKQFPQGIV